MPALLSIGNSCLAPHIAEGVSIYAGRSPLDWTQCKAISVARVLACLYTHSTEQFLDKFFTFQEKGPESDLGNYNREFDLYAPHHEGKYAEIAGGIYSPTDNTREKMERRVERFVSILRNKDDFLYLLHTGNIFPSDKKPYEDLLKVRELVGLFRPLDTFRIVYMDSNHTEAAPKEIDCIVSRTVSKHTYWIYPSRDVLYTYLESKGVVLK